MSTSITTQTEKLGLLDWDWRDWKCILIVACVAILFGLTVMMFIDWLLQEVFGPKCSRCGTGGAHWRGIHKNYRIQRGR